MDKEEKRTEDTLDCHLHGFKCEVKNDGGWLGQVKAYTVADLMALVTGVQNNFQNYGALAVKEAEVKIPLATLTTWDAVEEHKELQDPVRVKSRVTMQDEDETLNCSLYFGKLEDLLEEQGKITSTGNLGRRFWKTGGKMAGDYGIIMLSALAGGLVGGVSRVAGLVLARGGAAYGTFKMGRRVYNECIPTGFCTMELEPTGKMVSTEKANTYRKVIELYKKV